MWKKMALVAIDVAAVLTIVTFIVVVTLLLVAAREPACGQPW